MFDDTKSGIIDALAFGAHPDDVDMTAGGLLCRLVDSGLKVGMIDLTRGERGARGTRFILSAPKYPSDSWVSATLA